MARSAKEAAAQKVVLKGERGFWIDPSSFSASFELLLKLGLQQSRRERAERSVERDRMLDSS